MSTLSIIIISIISVVIIASIITTIVYLDIKKRENKKEEETPCIVTWNEDSEEDKETITLVAAKREKGSAVNGFETDLEFKERVSKLSKEEFLKLGLMINPLEILPKEKREKNVIYAYDTKGKVNKKNYNLLTRTFKK